MLNTELGIPCATISNYYNAAGLSQQITAAAKEAAAAAEAEMNRTRQYIVRGFGNAILQANSEEAFNAALDKLAQEKRNVGGGTFIGLVSLFGRPYRKTKTQHTCTTDDCRKRTLEAIQEFEKANQSLVDEKRKQLSQIEVPTNTPTPTPIQKPAPIPNIAPIVANQPPVGVSIPTDDMQSGTTQQQNDTNKNSVIIGGQQINKSTLIFGAVGLGIAGILFYKWR